ncbi:MAG: glycosyltransferase family 4 protein [Flavobacteriaceae bacterium]|nr:glycosyltransferase family 4 protein [Flavobacteriaceae bacterium]
MKILYFYQYYATPKGSWGTRVHEFAQEWVKKGHKVQVVTSIYSKSDLVAKKFIEHQKFNGVDVTIINVRIDNKQPILKRVFTFLAYAIFSSWYALTASADIVVASSGPISVGIPGLIARYMRRRKLVFETRDLWPEGAIELGLLKSKWAQKMAYSLEASCYKASSLIVALSVGMRQNIERRFPNAKVIDVTNAANIPLFSTPKGFDGRGKLKKKKYAIYTGNIGPVNNSLWLLEAAKILQNKGRTDLKIVLIGEGQQREFIQNEISQNQLKTIMVWGLMPKEKLVGLVQHAIVSLVPLKGTPVLDTSSPNKFFESLAAGVPVIQNTQGWMKDFLNVHKVGFTLSPNDPEILAEKLIELDSKPELLMEMGIRAKSLAAQEFDKDYLASKMLKAIEQVLQ